MQSIDSIINENKGLVYKQLWKFKLANDPEAESIAFEALYNAITTYNGSTKLSTYATVLIYNALGSYVRTLNNKRQLQVVSYNSIAFSDEAGDHEFFELLQDDNNLERSYMHRELQSMAITAFNEEYNKLTNDKHKDILRTWKESDFEAQTKEIAVIVGVSQSYVSQVINRFKATLKKKLEEAYYD